MRQEAKVRGVLEADLSTALKDARDGLSAWRDAVRGLGDNPLYQRLKRAWRAQGPPSMAGVAATWAPLVTVLLVIGYLLVRLYLDERLFTHFDPLPLGILLLAVTVYTTWVGMGLFHVSYDAMALLGRLGGKGGAELQLDETVMAARLSDRDFLAAILASLLPRLWLRWFSVPIVSVGLLWLAYGWQARYEAATDTGFLSTVGITGKHLGTLAAMSPLAAGWLILLAAPVSVVLLMWLIALGRSLAVRWQLQLIAGSLSLMQLAWIPLSAMQALQWSTWTGWDDREVLADLLSAIFLSLLVLLVLVATLHFSRFAAGARALFAAAVPAAGVALCLAAILLASPLQAGRGALACYSILNNAVWSASCFALLNPLTLPHPALLGMDPVRGLIGIHPLRLAAIIIMIAASLAICSHAARLAVADWRKGEA